MKKLIAAAFTALAIASPAHAHVSEANISATKGILRYIRQVGVSLIRPKFRLDGLAGRYDPDTGTLTLCPETFKSSALLTETISHEAIHVAQACQGGPLLYGVPKSKVDDWADGVAVGLQNKWDGVQKATEHLTQEQRISEWEAYAFESHPLAVLTILTKACI